MWKVIMVIPNLRFTASIIFHDVLHGLWVGSGIDIASLEVKLLQKLMDMREDILYDIFMELYKVYEALDREICLERLEGYGVGPWSNHSLHTYWDRLRMVARICGYYGMEYQGF